MFFGVHELEHRDLRFDVSYQPGEIQFADSGDEITQCGMLKAWGVAKLVGSAIAEIRVKGHLRATVATACDRCLERAEIPIDSDFDLFYRPADTAFDGREETQIDEGEAEIAFYQGEGIELEDVLREFVLLSLPMRHICRPDCKGICPVCGGNRNLVECNCRQEPLDERWAALRNL